VYLGGFDSRVFTKMFHLFGPVCGLDKGINLRLISFMGTTNSEPDYRSASSTLVTRQRCDIIRQMVDPPSLWNDD